MAGVKVFAINAVLFGVALLVAPRMLLALTDAGPQYHVLILTAVGLTATVSGLLSMRLLRPGESWLQTALRGVLSVGVAGLIAAITFAGLSRMDPRVFRGVHDAAWLFLVVGEFTVIEWAVAFFPRTGSGLRGEASEPATSSRAPTPPAL